MEKNLGRKSTTPNFEQSLHELEILVQKMEDGALPLEESIKIYEKGIRLAKICQDALNQAEQRVQLLDLATEDLQNTESDAEE